MKVCDIREYQSHFKTQYEDAKKSQVFSIRFDPFDPRRFAALTEDAVKIFDIRTTKKPLILITDPYQR